MRGNPEAHTLIAPGNLDAALGLLAEEPGKWTPIAGGTELMVLHAAGHLRASKLVSLWGIRELKFIEETESHISIGAGVSFSHLRTNAIVASEFPLLSKAASWIGSIANQSRATIGGNVVNGSPAADSSPALLVYDAEIEIASARGHRQVAYRDFHTAYKRNVLEADELLYAVHLPRRFEQYRQYLRKVGTRRAMAISKVALAGIALMVEQKVQDVRVAAASLGPFPMRLHKTEAALDGQELSADSIRIVRQALLAEAQPIDDIRSTAEYRRNVAANLLEEFLTSLREGVSQ